MKIQQSLCTVATLCLMLAIVALASCEKAIFSEEEVNSPTGNLTVSVYQLEQMPFASLSRGSEALDAETRSGATRAAVTDYCNRLNFAVYEMDGSRVKLVNQTSDNVTEEHQTLSVSLERIVSLCRFVINDAIPAGVSKLEFYYTGGSGTFSATTGLGNVNSKQKIRDTGTIPEFRGCEVHG